MTEVGEKRERSNEKKRERGEQRQAVGRLHLLDVEHSFERGEDERSGHEAGDVGIQDDQQAPV